MANAESAIDNSIMANKSDHQEASSLAADIWRGIQRGSQDELRYDKEHYLDSTARLGLAVGGSHLLTIEDDLLKANKKVALAYGAILSSGHFLFSPGHLEEVGAKTKDSTSFSEAIAYVGSRFLTDAALTMGLTSATTRANWALQGEKHIDNIINNETKSYYQAPFRGTHGHWAGAKTITEPVFRQERAETLNRFLVNRGQPERFEQLVQRLDKMPEAKNQTTWRFDNTLNPTRTFNNYSQVLEFNPENVLAIAK